MLPKGVICMQAEAVNAFDASIWICLDEIRETFGLKDNEGQKGEWLACGFVPHSMVVAQIILQDYQRQPCLHHRVPNSAGVMTRSQSYRSIKSISPEEQEEHIRVQILRNKASRENLRRVKAASKTPRHGKEEPLLKQAINNSQVSSSQNV